MRPLFVSSGIAMSALILAVNIAHGQSAALPDAFVVEARLKAMSKAPTLKDLSTYKESLIACHWEVGKVTGGALKEKEIIVYHWSYLDSKFQEAVKWKIGEIRTLTLRPFDEVPVLNRLRKDEDIAVKYLDLPTYYDTALGKDLPPVLAEAMAGGKILAMLKGRFGKNADSLRMVTAGECHFGLSPNLLYDGTGNGKVVGVGGAGSGFGQHELGYRLALAEFPKIEWGIQGGGMDRPYGNWVGITDYRMHAGPAWPPLKGRGPAPITSGEIQVTILPGVAYARGVESLGVCQNIIREYGRRGKRFMIAPYFTGGEGERIPKPELFERFRSWSKVYPNFHFLDTYELTNKGDNKTGSLLIEKARVAEEAKGMLAPLIPWKLDPPDAKPDAAALFRAVKAGAGHAGDIVLGGAWIAKAMADPAGGAAFPDAGIPEAELVLRTAVASGKTPKRVVWAIEPLMLTAPKAEQSIGALSGPVWPQIGKQKGNLTPSHDGATTIRLGNGTTVARGKGTWEFCLETSLILEATLRELVRHNVGVVLALAPNDAGIPAIAYEGLADRMRAYTIIYKGVRFVEPAAVAGKSDAEIRSVIQAHLADPTRGVLKSAVPEKFTK